MLLGPGEETGGVHGREWGWQAARARLWGAWWQRVAVRSRVQAAVPVMSAVLTSSLGPSVKWDHVWSGLPQRATVREHGGGV